jgi:hypothetical protein|tara:strand:+ start:120 stop:350 length:231 start_codon:yes stop_codon:yes gene_type:complete
MSHEFKDDVDRFMDHIKATINLGLEAERRSRSMYTLWRTSQDRIVAGDKLREESDKMLKDAENMVYELIDNALEGE